MFYYLETFDKSTAKALYRTRSSGVNQYSACWTANGMPTSQRITTLLPCKCKNNEKSPCKIPRCDVSLTKTAA